MAKYTITAEPPIEGSDTQLFRVSSPGDSAIVWYYPASKSAKCARCSTILCGMSGCCPHAKAVKRFVQKRPA